MNTLTVLVTIGVDDLGFSPEERDQLRETIAKYVTSIPLLPKGATTRVKSVVVKD